VLTWCCMDTLQPMCSHWHLLIPAQRCRVCSSFPFPHLWLHSPRVRNPVHIYLLDQSLGMWPNFHYCHCPLQSTYALTPVLSQPHMRTPPSPNVGSRAHPMSPQYGCLFLFRVWHPVSAPPPHKFSPLPVQGLEQADLHAEAFLILLRTWHSTHVFPWWNISQFQCDWQSGSSGRVPTQQEHGPDSTPSTTKKNKSDLSISVCVCLTKTSPCDA
jgi:hypothetical protein